jgi:diguanylate cyclase (GGDEF)-like protein
VLEEALGMGDEFSVAYLDLDNFKPFNDAYGYGHGDEVIRLLGRILQEHTDSETEFVGHIGGDDFIALLRGPDWLDRCRKILSCFSGLVRKHYSLQHCEQGGITATDRFGITRQFSIMTLSIGVLRVKGGQNLLSPERIAELATAAKARAKLTHGDSISVAIFDRGLGSEPWGALEVVI